MRVSDIMNGEVYIVEPHDSLAHIRNLFLKHNVSRVLVFDKKPLGIITETDLADSFFNERRSIDEIPARDLMTTKIISIEGDTTVEEAAKLMLTKRVSGIPVTAQGKVMGEITKNDIVSYYASHRHGESQAKNAMTEKIETVNEYHTIFHALKLMAKKRIKRLVVMKDKKAVGILSEHDISMAQTKVKPTRITFIRKNSEGMDRRIVRTTPLIVGEIMNENLVTIPENTDLAKAASIMLDKKIGSLVVVKGGIPAGILSKTDILRQMCK